MTGERGRELADVGGLTVERAVEVQDLSDLEPGRHCARLELHADDLVHLFAVSPRVEPHQPDRPRIRHSQADGALHSGGLASAVRAQDAEDLAFAHRQ